MGLPAGMSFAEAVAPLREGGRQARCMVAQRPATKKPRQGAGLVGCIMLAQPALPTCTRMPNSGKIEVGHRATQA